MLSVEEIVVRPLTLWLIGGHDVLLDTAYDLLDSSAESSS